MSRSPFDEQQWLQHAEPQAGLEPLYDSTGPHRGGDEFLVREGRMMQAVAPDPDAGEKILVTNQKRPRLLWIGIAVIAALIITGAVVGGIFGSKVAHSHDISNSSTSNSNLTSNSNTSNSNYTSASTPNSNSTSDGSGGNSTILRQNSPLAVTGWRSSGLSYAQLFWQGNDSELYSATWESTHNLWNDPIRLGVAASPDTPMAASVIYQTAVPDGAPPFPQVQFYYRNTSSYLNGMNFGSSFPNGLPDGINANSFPMSSSSRLAEYWPLIVYQSESLDLQSIWYVSNTSAYTNAPQALSAPSLIASNRTPMAALPLQVQHPWGYYVPFMDLKLFYRKNDGHLYEFDRWSNGTVTKNDPLPGFDIAANASLAAFANARAAPSNLINTYIVYQAVDGTIMYGTNTDSSGWKGPKTDAVFEGADNPTNLACMTAAAGMVPLFPLMPTTELNRCYFQQRGELIEVMYDGIKWSKLGAIPMP